MMNATIENPGTAVVEATPIPVIDRAIHNEANFQPEQYEVLDYLDNRQPQYVDFMPPISLCAANPGAYAAAAEQARADYEAQLRQWNATMDSYFPGRHESNPSIHKCTHCGNTQVRYICAVKHRPTGVNVVFGDVCVERLQFANHDSFKAEQVRARAAQGNANLRLFHQREQFLASYPAFATVLNNVEEMSHPDHARNGFADDILAKFQKYGCLSERQVECFIQSLDRDHVYARQAAERAAQEAERRFTAQPAPEGRQTVEGEVVSVKRYEPAASYYGAETIMKMTVVLTTGAKVWLSVPNAADSSSIKGCKVRFAATFTRSATDQLFAFGKRPSKFEVLAEAPVAVQVDQL
jgi:hypothetical protein